MPSAPQEILDLVERFAHNADHYRRPDYNETQARREFIDPFFMALGWDVDNRKGVAPRYQEVIHEATLRERESVRAPDYCFRVGAERRFFVEAKKPAVNIATDIQPAYQLRRYAWTAKLPLSILTDFEQFSVYDCRTKPNSTDNPGAARLLLIPYGQYAERWDEIASIFSRDAVWRGDYDRYAETAKGKRGTQEVDDVFLQEIEAWRELLARNLALRNPDLGVRALNYAVQQIIDRLIFLRICEDRGIEPYEQLRNATQGSGVYPRLVELFRRADDRYNSGLFHFKTERGRDDPDLLTPALRLDDKPLTEIIHNLYYPHSPYAFEVLGVDILGNVYERFLGSVIRLTDGHQAKVEQKPEVRKAGGVYYTPKYIVDYIVKNTVGKLCEGKTPAQVSKLRILDPACGSGSFLLGAYQYLLDYHLTWYVEHPTKQARREVYQGRGGAWFLTTEEKKRILTNNLYGVDIDPQAVEVTKLSLLLKVLEGENQETIVQQGRLTGMAERVLPDLSSNIKCGNSLIGPDFYARQQGLGLMDEEEAYRVNAFDWEKEFPEVFAPPPARAARRGEEAGGRMQYAPTDGAPASSPLPDATPGGGFDAVIGNPPYVRQEQLGAQKGYLQQHYQVYHGVADLYAYFIERGVSLLREGGLFSYIVANKWLRANYGAPLRRWLKTQQIEEIVDFGDLPVFEQATTYPCILRVRRQRARRGEEAGASPSAEGRDSSPASSPLHPSIAVTQVDTLDFSDLAAYVAAHRYAVAQDTLAEGGWSLAVGGVEALLAKLRAVGSPLGEYVGRRIFYGIKTGLNEAFVIDAATRARLIAEDPRSVELIKPFLAGRDVKRYQPPQSERWLILMPRGWTRQQSAGAADAWGWLQAHYPAIAAHLAPFAAAAQKRYDKGEYWWELRACDYYAEFEKPKIILPDISLRGNFAFDEQGSFYSVNTTYIIPASDKYLVGILNSTLTTFVYKTISSAYRGGYLRFIYQYLVQLPIRTLNLADPAERARHDEMVALVERMLALHQRLAAAPTPQEKTMLQRQIEATDQQIDHLVYALYDLTEEEIQIVEQSQ